MTEIRCVKCKRLLMKGEHPIRAEVKCPKCGYLNRLMTFKEVIYYVDKDQPVKMITFSDSMRKGTTKVLNLAE